MPFSALSEKSLAFFRFEKYGKVYDWEDLQDLIRPVHKPKT